jgi:hypothetical protein
MKNQFKKQDAKGNKLPEQIGEGINKNHLIKVLKEIRVNDSSIHFRLPKEVHEQLIFECEKLQCTQSYYLQQLLINNFKNK